MPILDPVQAIKQSKLRYVVDDESWFIREQQGKEFVVLSSNKETLLDHNLAERVKQLRIPPNWIDVKICPVDNGHIQAIGRDQKGRKQYLYHADWKLVRQQHKFESMITFGEALPELRAQVLSDMRLQGLPREKVLATIVWLMEHTFIRIGNAEYAKQNKSYGLTTIRDKHVQVSGKQATFSFKGKSGVEHEVEIDHPRVAKIIKQCRDLPGFELFQYLDDEGVKRDVGSADVNEYLRSIMGQEITAKDFRTWGGTTLSATTLHQLGEPETITQKKKNLVATVKEVAMHLGNKPATCRNYYIHPKVFQLYEDDLLISKFTQAVESSSDATTNLQIEEQAVLELLKEKGFK